MHVIVTGAGGFVGQALVQRLLEDASALPRALTRLTAIDQRFAPSTERWRADPRVALLAGDFADPALLASALSTTPDCVFHLASVPGSLAEREPVLGLQVNLMAPLALLHRLAEAATPPRVVFASSVAVYGASPAEGRIDESAPTRPLLSYGAHKLMTEVLLADLSRRGVIDGLSLRLPGIVARPLSPTGHGSAFMSDLIRRLAAGEPYECPVSPQARAWWMSLPCCVDNLLHAARLSEPDRAPQRTVQLPVLSATVGEVVTAIGAIGGRHEQVASLVTWRPDARTEALFGRLPPLDTPNARAIGFRDDGSLERLVQQALAADTAL
jgi:nucleoside-diphosphate-sugar epimerase